MAETKHRLSVPSEPYARNQHHHQHESPHRRRNDVLVSPELLITERKHQGPSATDCIDLTAYEDVKEERESTAMSTISELKIDERSSSNCENEAAVAVNNIKTLLDLGDNDEITLGPMITMNRNENNTNSKTRNVRPTSNSSSSNNNDTPYRKQSTPEVTTSGNYQDGPIRLWTADEPPRPEHYHPPKSEYHMAKERLMSQRRQNSHKNSTRTASTKTDAADVLHLTQKHEALVRKSSEYRNNNSNGTNSGAMIEVIHIENDQPPLSTSPKNYASPKHYASHTSPKSLASPSSPKSYSNRLFIDTSDMVKLLEEVTPLRRNKYDDNDLVSAFGYEFKKRDNDEQSDIIVIDDVIRSETKRSSGGDQKTLASIAGQNVAARYEAIRNSVAGRISNMERTDIHPLATPSLRAVPEMKKEMNKPRDLSPSKIHFIRDRVKSLQEQQQHQQHTDVNNNQSELDDDMKAFPTTEESIGTEQPSPIDAMSRSPSRASAIEGLLASEKKKSISQQDRIINLDDDSEEAPLRAEAEYRKKSKGSPSSKTTKADDTFKGESDFIAITRNLSSKTLMTELLNESSLVIPSPEHNENEDPQTETTVKQQTQSMKEDRHSDNASNMTSKAVMVTPETDVQSFAITKKESPVLITAAELCVGFCSNNRDSISVPDDAKEMALDRKDPMVMTLSPVHSVCSAVDRAASPTENIDPTPSTATSQYSVESKNESVGPTDQPLSTSVAHVNLSKSKSNERRKEGRVNDLGLSDDESSESYPSDVEVNDDEEINYVNKTKFVSNNSNSMVKYSDTVDMKTQSSKSVVSTATESNLKRNTEASVSDNASFVSDNSGTRASLGDSDNSDSDDEDTGIYDACFARQIFDDTCAWLERDETSFCFRPSLLKKVKRRNVGHIKKYYGRSPLVLRVPRNPIITRNYLQSRRKVQENPELRSRKTKPNSSNNAKNSETQSTLLRFRQNQAIFGVDMTQQNDSAAKGTSNKNVDIKKVVPDTKTHENIEDVVTPISSNISKATDTETLTNEYSVAESSGVFEADSKNLAIFEVKSAEEYTSRHFSAYQQSLRSRSMSPVFLSKKRSEKLTMNNPSTQVIGIQSTNKIDHSDVITEVCAKIESSRSHEQSTLSKPTIEENEMKLEPIDCTGTKAESDVSSMQWIESPDAPGFNEYGDEDFSTRPKSRREGLAKLRHHKSPVRHELIQLEHVESEMESTDNSALNEEQRLAALDMAEKLRRRAMTLRRRRKLRERRREVRCMDSQMVVS
jgi:hypothetical protein